MNATQAYNNIPDAYNAFQHQIFGNNTVSYPKHYPTELFTK